MLFFLLVLLSEFCLDFFFDFERDIMHTLYINYYFNIILFLKVKKYEYRGIRSVCVYGGGNIREQLNIIKVTIFYIRPLKRNCRLNI